MMEDSKVSNAPVPLPRNRPVTKTPVPLPRTTANVLTDDDRKNESKEKGKTNKCSSLEHTNSIRKSLRKVTSNVQEKSNAVIMSAKNVSSKMESSVRNILSKRHTVAGDEESKSQDEQSNSHDEEVNYVRCQSLPCDDIFRDISFDSPLASPDNYSIYSEPPSYPPPPPPDDSHYDELRSSRPSSTITSEITPPETIYEEIHGLKNISGACSPCSTLPDEGRILNRSDSWSYYDAPIWVSKPRGHSYENVALEYLPTESSQNIYSDEPAKSSICKVPILCPSDTVSVCSSKAITNEHYENWNPPTLPRKPPSSATRSEKSSTTKSVIYEFDPLFDHGKSKPADQEEKCEALESSAKHSENQKCLTAPSNLNDLPEDVEMTENDGEYFLYHRAGPYKGLLSDEPKEIPVLTQGKKRTSLVRWDSMKRALKMVTESAPWSPMMSRRGHKNKDENFKTGKMGKAHNGHLYKSPSNGEKAKDFVQKWCQLGDGKITLLVEKHSNNNEIISVETILSIQAIVETKQTTDGDPLHCWELNTTCRAKPHLFGASSPTECRLWMRTILESLTNVFPSSIAAEYHRAGQCFLKEGISSHWCGAWIVLASRKLHYCQIEGQKQEIDLRKARFIVLSDDEGKCTSASEVGPYIKVHTVEEVVYLQMDCIRETKAWFNCIKTSALENGTRLDEQQLTKDYVPVIADKCINFVYAHGSMSEGIYRRSGSSSKVTSLLSLLRKDAWEVQLSRQDYSEYDVSSVLKRFFRDLPEPLLTKNLYKYFSSIPSIKCPPSDKDSMYRNYLGKLPQVNYVTLRRLIGHLHFIHELAEKNKMPVENLAAIWAPTLMHVEGKEGMEYTKKECEVISELIIGYKSIFQVEDEESQREKRILEVLERVHESPQILPLSKPSGDLKIAIYIGSRRGESVTIPINPSMDSGKLCTMLAGKTEYAPHELCLTECVLGGMLSRPLHHTDLVLETVLKWAYWETTDSKENYLLLAHNVLYKEILPLAKPPISKSGELKFADRKAKAFKNFMFEFSQAKLRCYKDKSCGTKLREWKIEDIIWYLGHESKRNPQTRWSITFIEKKDPIKRTKEYPFFGNTIAGTTKEDHLQWIAAMLLGQYQHSDLFLKPPEFL